MLKTLLVSAAAALAAYALCQLFTPARRKILHENISLIAKILLLLALFALVWQGGRRIFP